LRSAISCKDLFKDFGGFHQPPTSYIGGIGVISHGGAGKQEEARNPFYYAVGSICQSLYLIKIDIETLGNGVAN